MSRLPLSLLLLTAMLGGCAASAEFPSLAPRAIEKAAQDEPRPAPVAETGADAELQKRLAAIVESGESGHRAFLAELANARPLVARAAGSTAGSEAWVAAQQAYTAADAAHGALGAALADLDTLRREEVDNANPANRAALDQAAQRLTTLDADERTALAELAARLG